MAAPKRAVKRAVRSGKPRAMTPARRAAINRWQMMGAAARRGQKKAQTANYRSARAKGRKEILSTYASATKWGVQKLVMPVGGNLMTLGKNMVPGYNAYQVARAGTRSSSTRKRRR